MQPSAKQVVAASVTALLILASTLSTTPAAEAARRHGGACHRQQGRAMFYGPGFEGRTMANGHRFNPAALTAASRTLPLGIRARVTNRQTRRSVVLRITDRGRLRARGVILDLSVGAARAIGLTGRQGVARVTVVPLRTRGTACG